MISPQDLHITYCYYTYITTTQDSIFTDERVFHALLVLMKSR